MLKKCCMTMITEIYLEKFLAWIFWAEKIYFGNFENNRVKISEIF